MIPAGLVFRLFTAGLGLARRACVPGRPSGLAVIMSALRTECACVVFCWCDVTHVFIIRSLVSGAGQSPNNVAREFESRVLAISNSKIPRQPTKIIAPHLWDVHVFKK